MTRRALRIGLFATLVLGSVAWAQERHELRFPDLPGLRTLKCDLHMHTVFSDGDVWPPVRVDEAWREGLDAIAISDHIEHQPHKADVSTDFNRSFELARRRAEERNILLVHAAEITRDTPPGHFNALFLKDITPLKKPDLPDVFQAVADQQGFLFWNHPGWQGLEKGKWAEVQQQAFDKKQMRGIEICNENEYYPEAYRWAIDKGLTILGDSDIHPPSSDRPYTPEVHRTLTLVFARERSLEAVHEALNAGRTAVWCRNRLFGSEANLAALFAAAVEVRPVHYRAGDTVFFEVVNRCEMDIILDRAQPGDKDRVTLPACATTLMRLPEKQLKDGTFRVENFLVAPDRSLEIKLSGPRH